MQYSTNFNLNKPERADQYNLDHWNGNTDIIDTELNALQNITNSTFKTALLNFCYPVGSLYWSSKSTNPSTLFGGTWTQIKDRFVLACGDTYNTTGATGGASAVTLSVSNMPSHSHTFTPSGTITMNSHSHGLNNHTHSFTPSGTILSNGGHWHKFFAADNGMSNSNTKSSEYDNMVRDPSSTHMTNQSSVTSSGSIYYFPPEAFANSGHRNTAIDAEGTGHRYRYDKTYYFSESVVTSWSGYHSHSFTGTSSNTGGNSGNTTSTTSTGSFSGTQGTTSSEGSGTAFNILPPYVVKYCWERTA